MLDLASVNTMINNGDDHLRSFNDTVHGWREREPWTVVKDRSEDYRTFMAGMIVDEMPDLHQWAAKVGDIVGNYRQALDHLVYALAVAESGVDPPPDEGVLQFPICDKPAWFRKQRDRRLASLAPETIAAIEGAQPLGGKDRVHLLPLRQLRDLNDPHKHRKVRLSAMHFRDLTLNGDGLIPGGEVVITVKEQAVLGPEYAPLWRLDFADPQTNSEMNMECKMTVGITLGDGPLEKRPTLDTLGDIRETVRWIVGVIAADFEARANA